jgi:Holliday junction resolvasome RuvABC endonuclease subunit
MKNKNENKGVIGIAPSSRGFGFAVMTTKSGLVDWGVKSVKSGKKNERSLSHVVKLIEIYEPRLIVVENCLKNRRKGERVRALIDEIVALAGENGIRVKTLSGKQVNLSILRNEAGTKHQIATSLANKYGQQLSFRLPAKRRAWQSESYQMDIFDAVALAQCCCTQN